MAAQTWAVTLYRQGNRIDTEVQANSQSQARQFAEHHYPGYKAGAARRV